MRKDLHRLSKSVFGLLPYLSRRQQRDRKQTLSDTGTVAMRVGKDFEAGI